MGLSEVAANRLGVEVGGTVELPTVHGPRNYQVAGVFRPHVINDTALGTSSWCRSSWRDPIGGGARPDRGELLLARRGDRPPR